MSQEKLKKINLAIIGLSILAILAVMVYTIGDIAFLTASSVVLTVWAISPFIVLYILLKRTVSPHILRIITGVSIIFAGSLYVYYEAFFLYLDGQSGLIFLFLPLYQMLALLVVFGTIGLAKLFFKASKSISSRR